MSEEDALALKVGDRVEVEITCVGGEQFKQRATETKNATVRIAPRRLKNGKVFVVCKLDGNFIVGGIVIAKPNQIKHLAQNE